MEIRNLFCVNITDNKNNEIGDELNLVTKKVDTYQENSIEKAIESTEIQEQLESLPTLLKIIKSIGFFIWMISLSGLIRSLSSKITLAQAYKNAPVIMILLPVAFAIWLVIYLYEKSLKKNSINSHEYMQLEYQIESTIKTSKSILGIPDDALKMDVLGFRYKIKDGKVKRVNTGLTEFINQEKYLYIKNSDIYIADLVQLITIPLDQLISVEKVNKKIAIPLWNKDVEPTKGKYKQYKIGVNQMGMIFFKPYYIAHFDSGTHFYDLYIPVYDIHHFVKITGITINN